LQNVAFTVVIFLLFILTRLMPKEYDYSAEKFSQENSAGGESALVRFGVGGF
jgi:hypothetical protein